MKTSDLVDNAVSVFSARQWTRRITRWNATVLHFQVQGICSIEKTLLAADTAAGKIKIVSGLSGTRKFLKMLGNLSDTFGIHAKGQSTKKNNARAS